MSKRWAEAVLRHPGLAWTGLLLAIVLAVIGATGLRVDFSSQAFYADDASGHDDDASGRDDLERFVQRWGSDDRSLFVIARTDDPRGVLTPERLDALREVADELRASPDVVSVVEIGGLPALGDATVRDLVTDPRRGPTARRIVSTDRRVVPLLLSEDGRTTAIIVELARATDDLGATVDTVATLRKVVEARERAGLSFELAGLPAIRAGFFELVLRDQMRFVPLTLAMMALALWLVFGRVHGVVVPAVAAGLPCLLLVDTMGAMGEPIGLLNQAYFTLLPVIAVADSIHVVHRVHREAASVVHDDREGRRAAIVRAMGGVGRACFLTSITTAIGFASLAIADMPVLRSFGLYAALGIAYAWLTVVLVIPLLLGGVRGPLRPRRASTTLSSIAARSAAFAVRRPVATSLAAAGLGIMAVVAVPRVVVDNHITALLDAEHPTRLASERVDRSLGGSLSLEIELERSEGWHDPESRRTLERLEFWLREQPEVRAVAGPSLPALPGGPRFVDASGRVARVSVRVPDLGGRAFGQLRERIDGRLESIPDVRARITGTTTVAYAGVNRITTDLRGSLWLVFATVSLLIAALLRNLRFGLTAIPPNLLPPLLAYAAVGMLGIELDPLATVVLTVALGIAVDDTIHILSGVAELRARGVGGSASIVEAVRESGAAVIVTSLVLCGGLAMNLGSSFPPMRLLGGLGCGVIGLALLGDLLLLPALLELSERRRFGVPLLRPESESAATIPD